MPGHPRRYLGVLGLLLAAFANPALAGKGIWTTQGPASAEAIAVSPGDPPVIYAGTSAVYRSTNGGKEWVPVVTAPPGTYVTALAADPSNPNVVYGIATGNFTGSFYGSTDAGQSWSLLKSVDWSVTGILLDPSHTERLYLYGATSIFRRWDVEVPWTNLWPGGIVTALAIDAANSSALYAGSDEGLWTSQDTGRTWASTGPRGESACPQVRAIAIDPHDGRHILASHFEIECYKLGCHFACWGAVSSRDGGRTWTAMANAPVGIRSFLFAEADPERIFAVASYRTTLYPGYRYTVYQSRDAGDTWETMDTGLSSDVYQLRMDSTGKVLYAATDDGVFDFEIPGDDDLVLVPVGRPRTTTRSLDPRP